MISSRASNTNVFGQTAAKLRGLVRRLGLAGTQPAPADLTSGLASDSSSADDRVEAVAARAVAGGVAGEVSRVTFLPRDPQWAYVFWTLSAADRERVAQAGGRLGLRVADVTGLPLGSSHPHALQELEVEGSVSEWYLPVPLSDRDYRVELGLRQGPGGWLTLAVSSVARVPALGPSEVVADAFVAFNLEGAAGAVSAAEASSGVLHERLYQLASTAPGRRRGLGSEALHERDQAGERGAGGQASGAGVWASGRNDSGQGLARQRAFWLVADAELIVYGATEPSASLFIGDGAVPLAADGTFRVQVPFRDGEQLYPIRAVAVDGEQERSIRLEFHRATPEAKVNTREEAELAWF